MVALFSLLLVFALSLLINRVGTVALTMTGVSEEVASFQSLSAFSGTGFTTGEAENVVGGPARRRIISLLIRLGSLGVITAISSLVLSFAGPDEQTPERLAVLFLGVLGLLALARSRAFNRLLTPLIRRSLQRYTTLDLYDYANLLHLREDYRVAEVDADPGNWLTRAPLGELSLGEEGVIVLGIVRQSGEYIGAPTPNQRIQAGDRVIVYGRASRVQELRRRPVSDQTAHENAKEEQRAISAQQPE